jgi:hypothetical protein
LGTDSVVVSVEDLRTSIKIFSEFEKLNKEQDVLELMIPKYDNILDITSKTEAEYKLIITNIEMKSQITNMLYETKIEDYKEKLKIANRNFIISASAAVGLLLILIL